MQDLVALDCELFYTTAGMSLARLTVVAQDGDLLLDSHVRPPRSATIVDLNTRYSGIQERDLDKADKDLVAVRDELARWVGEETVLVGHGLENDLNALRLIHKRVIDTAIVSIEQLSVPCSGQHRLTSSLCSSFRIRTEARGGTL